MARQSDDYCLAPRLEALTNAWSGMLPSLSGDPLPPERFELMGTCVVIRPVASRAAERGMTPFGRLLQHPPDGAAPGKRLSPPGKGA